MKVKEIKELLNNLDESYDDAEVIMSRDSEGNDYSPFSDISTDAVYVEQASWYGDVYYESSYDNKKEWNEILEDNDCKKAIILWPRN